MQALSSWVVRHRLIVTSLWLAIYAGSTHHLNIDIVFVVAAAAAIAGDNAGYWVGRTGGQRLADRYGRFMRLDATKLAVGRYLFARHGRIPRLSSATSANTAM